VQLELWKPFHFSFKQSPLTTHTDNSTQIHGWPLILCLRSISVPVDQSSSTCCISSKRKHLALDHSQMRASRSVPQFLHVSPACLVWRGAAAVTDPQAMLSKEPLGARQSGFPTASLYQQQEEFLRAFLLRGPAKTSIGIFSNKYLNSRTAGSVPLKVLNSY